MAMNPNLEKKDKSAIISLLRKGRKMETIRNKFPQYSFRTIGAISQHLTKGDYDKKIVKITKRK